MLYAEICPKVRRHNARPCYMPKYVPRLEGIMHDPKGSALCLLTLGHISAFNMDNTQHNIIVIITLNVFGDYKK